MFIFRKYILTYIQKKNYFGIFSKIICKGLTIKGKINKVNYINFSSSKDTPTTHRVGEDVHHTCISLKDSYPE